MINLTKHFHSDNQNFFEIGSIPNAAIGLSIVIGSQLANEYGAGIAICSIVVGNLILWIIGISVISINEQHGNTGIDNIKLFFGRVGGLISSLILMFAFLNWYAFHLTFSTQALNQLLHLDNNLVLDLSLRFGVMLGLLCALLSVGGIRMLKRLSIIAFPLLLIFHSYAISISDQSITLKGTFGLSFYAVMTSVLLLLPGVINFPTFFRHARSKAHAYLALTMFVVFTTFFEISTIWINFYSAVSGFNIIVTAVFISIMLTTCNLLNIYLASACWRTIVPNFESPKGFAIIGLFGTLTYTFIQISSPVQFLQELTNSYIACLGVVLMFAFAARIMIKHRPRKFDKLMNLVTWLFGCVIATIYEIKPAYKGLPALLNGLTASILFFMTIIFIEEIVWALRKKQRAHVAKVK